MISIDLPEVCQSNSDKLSTLPDDYMVIVSVINQKKGCRSDYLLKQYEIDALSPEMKEVIYSETEHMQYLIAQDEKE